MIARVFSATTLGFTGERIEVECDASNGLPTLLIVGLGNKAVDEAKERVRSAIKNSGLEFPRKRITINLAPANLPKDGAHFDLAIAIAILVVSGQISQQAIANTLFVGELALDGTLRAVRGAISYAETARRSAVPTLILPKQNTNQAMLINDVTILPADSLQAVVAHLTGRQRLSAASPVSMPAAPHGQFVSIEDVRGHEQAKRALLIAAAGRHNLLFSGPPGTGKSMLAQALNSILPPLSSQEIVDVTKIHSLAGEAYEEVIRRRPFRSPHHSSSHVALVGGGQQPRPGEISLAHKGVLFLDELPEYTRLALESLRQPLEDRTISIARAHHRITYPADFMLIATRNPCPCGYAGDNTRECTCTPLQILMYQKKISGPLLDRIDMAVDISRIDTKKLLGAGQGLLLSDAKRLIAGAGAMQQTRFGNSETTNAHITSAQLRSHLQIQRPAKQLLDNASRALHLSARSYIKVLKVARTIADIEASATVDVSHISEALQYRPRHDSG